MKIDPNLYYAPTAPELRPLAAVQTLARWRHEGRGPAFVKSGARVLYQGCDILAWLNANRITTGEIPCHIAAIAGVWIVRMIRVEIVIQGDKAWNRREIAVCLDESGCSAFDYHLRVAVALVENGTESLHAFLIIFEHQDEHFL